MVAAQSNAVNNVFYFDKLLWHYWRMIDNTNYKNADKNDLLKKLEELNIKRQKRLSEEDWQLRNNILGFLEGVELDDNHTLQISSSSSSSVEDTLNILGNIVITIGTIAGFIIIFYGLLEELLLMVIWGIAGILSALISGYILKGLSKVISLLSSLKNSNNEEH